VFFARRSMPGEDRAPGRAAGGFGELFTGERARASTALLGLLALHMTGFWCTYAWLPAVLLKHHGVSLAFVGWFQIGVNSVHVFADVLFGFVADRFGRRRTFVAFCLLFASGLLLLAFGFEAVRTDLRWFGLVLALIGVGAGTWSCFGVLFAENYEPRVRATAASSFYNISRGVQLFTQPLMGWLFVTTGTLAVALHVGAATAVLSAIAIHAVPRVERDRPDQS
jgi:MFS family permease